MGKALDSVDLNVFNHSESFKRWLYNSAWKNWTYHEASDLFESFSNNLFDSYLLLLLWATSQEMMTQKGRMVQVSRMRHGRATMFSDRSHFLSYSFIVNAILTLCGHCKPDFWIKRFFVIQERQWLFFIGASHNHSKPLNKGRQLVTQSVWASCPAPLEQTSPKSWGVWKGTNSPFPFHFQRQQPSEIVLDSPIIPKAS